MRRAVVVGLGSMGKRRIRLMRQFDPAMAIVGVDSQPSRREEAKQLYGIECFPSIREAVEQASPAFGFVCTGPLAHHAIIVELLGYGLNVFTEINLVDDGYAEMTALAREKGKVLFLSSTFLYRKDVQFLIGQSQGKKVDYIIHTGQYLPDWHPWESYKEYFVGNVRTNGCREIMAIDLPWILAAFGKVADIHVRKSEDSHLELGYEDNYLLSLQHENGSKGVIVFDVISRKAGRSAEIFSEDMYLTWRGTPDSLYAFDADRKEMLPVKTYDEALDHQAAYASNIIENAYLSEIETFFSVVEQGQAPRYTFDDDLYTIDLINRIEGRR